MSADDSSVIPDNFTFGLCVVPVKNELVLSGVTDSPVTDNDFVFGFNSDPLKDILLDFSDGSARPVSTLVSNSDDLLSANNVLSLTFDLALTSSSSSSSDISPSSNSSRGFFLPFTCTTSSSSASSSFAFALLGAFAFACNGALYLSINAFN